MVKYNSYQPTIKYLKWLVTVALILQSS